MTKKEHDTMDVVLVPARHDGRTVSGPRSRHAVPVRTRHEKGSPFKHDRNPSKHEYTTAGCSPSQTGPTHPTTPTHTQINHNHPQPPHLQSRRRPSPPSASTPASFVPPPWAREADERHRCVAPRRARAAVARPRGRPGAATRPMSAAAVGTTTRTTSAAGGRPRFLFVCISNEFLN
jgi:hypothetical protein